MTHTAAGTGDSKMIIIKAAGCTHFCVSVASSAITLCGKNIQSEYYTPRDNEVTCRQCLSVQKEMNA